MGSVPLRIQRISENLRLIQNEIALLAGPDFEVISESETLSEPDVKALCKVKASVDHLRQMLRTYIDFASAQVAEQDSEEFQALRAERTSHILRFACAGLQMLEGKDREVPSSLFEQLMQLAFAEVDRHRTPPAPTRNPLVSTAEGAALHDRL